MRVRVVTLVDRVGVPGGGERFAGQVAAALDPARFESLLCVSRPSPPEAVAALRADGVRVVELGRRSRGSLRPWLRFLRLLREERVQVLHSHKFGSNVWAALLARASGVPVFVAHEHSWAFAGSRTRLLLDRHLVAPRAAAIVAVSEHDRARIVELERVPPERVVVARNGVPPLAGVRPGALRRELGADGETPIVGLVGRLRPEKRVDLLLDAVARLRAEGRPVLAAVVGDGPEEPRLRRRAAELGIAPHVAFLGRRDDALALAVDADVAVLCSDREGLPLTLLEYMALGLPIVATRVGGVPEAVRDGREALLVEPGRPQELAAAIGRLLDDRGLAARLGEAAGRRRADEFELDAAVRRLESLYEDLLSAGGPATAVAAPHPAAARGGGSRDGGDGRR